MKGSPPKNRLISVTKTDIITTFLYDGDGHPSINSGHRRVKATVSGATTTFIGTPFEWKGSTSTMVKYYYAGSQRIAMRTGSRANPNLKWLLGDHLGSTSITADYNAANPVTTLSKPWGGRKRRFRVRYQSGTLPTKYTYTGQYSHTTDFGLMDYVARWYDPVLGRFAQADTLVPGAGKPLAWDRYAYTLNNPVNYTDPTGHLTCGTNSHIASGDCSTLIYPTKIPMVYVDGKWDSKATWAQIKDDPVELIARAIMTEEGNKLLTDEADDALGAAWVIKNRHDEWYANPDGVNHNKFAEEDYWLYASTSGVHGMGSYSLANAATDPTNHPSYFGASGLDALVAYNIALEFANEAYTSSSSNDPTNGAYYWYDAYCTYSDCKKNPETGKPYVTPWNRTHFESDPSDESWCIESATVCN